MAGPPKAPNTWLTTCCATVAWLERVRSELLQSLDPDDLRGSARRRIEAEGRALAEQAMRVPGPDAWIEEAEALSDSYEEPIDPAERAALACRLFDDLDDAELAAFTAGRLGVQDPGLQQGIDRCRDWFAQHADAFLSAGVYVQAVGQALRPDLPQCTPDLARTSEKVVQVLQALEDMEADLAFRWVEPIEPEALWPLIERFASGQPVGDFEADSEGDRRGIGVESMPIAAVYPFQAEEVFSFPVFQLAAQGGEPESLPITCEWRSPDGKFLACLDLFRAPASDQEIVTVAFLNHDEQPAHALAGQPVRLGDRPARVEDVGPNVAARFTWGELSQLVGDLRLLVGPDHEEWDAVSDAS